MINVIVVYPAEDEGWFDIDYYLNRHIPFFEELFRPFGLVRIEVDGGMETIPHGDRPVFRVMTRMRFRSVDELRCGIRRCEPRINEDVPRFTNLTPIVQVNEVLR